MRRFIVTILLLATAVAVFAQQTLPTRLQKVALFKQGYGIMVREVTLPAGETDALITDMPTPVHGTFWLIAPRNITLSSVIATKGDRPTDLPAVTLPELLRANIGERVEIKTADGWVAGKLLSVADNRTTESRIPAPVSNRYYDYYGRPQMPGEMEAGNLLVLDTADGPTALPVSAVLQIRKRPGDGALKTTFTRGEQGAVLRLHAAGPGGTVQIAYMTRGITWAPSYRLEINGDTARLTGKAVIINDAEDITARELACVAGYPNVKFAGVLDPLGMQETLAQFLASLQAPNGGPGSPVMSQVVMQNAAYNERGGGMQPLPLPDADPDDLHFFRFANVTLGYGDRAYLPLVDLDVPCAEVYRWDARDLRDDPSRNNYPQPKDVPDAEDIWHAVRMKNPAASPWTTAPVMVTRGDEFLGQDILYYTSGNGSTLVNITKAVDVKAKMSEATQQEGELTTIGNNRYQKYIIGGRLNVTNFKAAPVHLIITKQLTGDVIETSVKPVSMDEAPRTDLANARRTVVWEVDIPAGQSLDITYKYKVFIYAD